MYMSLAKRTPYQTRGRDSNATESAKWKTNLASVITLFDLVLAEDYIPANLASQTVDADEEPSPEQSRNHLGATSRPASKKGPLPPEALVECDFCGSDIFVHFLECDTCSPLEHRTDSGFCLCMRCYVDGRSCSCGRMRVKSNQAFSQLLADRNQAVRTLLEVSASASFAVLDEA